MKLNIIYYMAFAVSFTSCVSTSRYQSLTSRSEQLQLSNSELKKENDSLRILGEELLLTKKQLEKTETVLIEFYQKYEGKTSFGDSVAFKNNESQWDTVQSEMNKLVIENSRLQDEIKKYESELVNLKNQIQSNEKKQSTVKEKNKTADLLNKQLNESQNNQKNLKTELSNKEVEVNKLNKEIAALKFNKTEFQNQSKQNDHLIDSLNSEIQFLNLKNKDLAIQITDLNNKFEETDRNNREALNADKINLQNELTNLNIKIHSKESEINYLTDSLKFKNEELEKLQKSTEESKLIIDQQRLKIEAKSTSKNNADQKEEIAKLKSDLNLAEKSLSALNDAIDDNHQEIKDLKEHIDANQEEIVSLQKKLNSKDNSKNTGLFGELKTEPINESKNESLTHAIQLEKDSLINTINNLNSEKEINASEKKKLDLELDSKNKQIEILSLKYSEKLNQDDHTAELKSLQDSIGYFQNEAIRMQHVNKSLESEIRRNQASITIRESMIDSLRKFISLSNTNSNIPGDDKPSIAKTNQEPTQRNEPALVKKEVSTNPTKLSPAIQQQNKIKNENITSKPKVDSLKTMVMSKPKTSKTSGPKIPNALLEKLTYFATEQSNTGILSFQENSGILLVLPQSYVFEGDRNAMTQKGSELIMKLSSVLKPYTTIKINLTGYGSTDQTGSKSIESSLKHANTIFKLMSVSGINSSSMKSSSVLTSEHSNQKIPPAGVEIRIHAE